MLTAQLEIHSKKINKNIYNLRNWSLFGAPKGSVEKDAYVWAGTNANINYGTENTMLAKEAIDANYRRRSLIMLKVDPSITTATQISSAKLKLYCNSISNNNAVITVSLYRIPSTWYQTTVTYNNSPTDVHTVALNSADFVASKVITTVNNYYEWDITTDIKNLVNDGFQTRSYMIVAQSGGIVVGFNTFEAPTNKPVFEINSYSYNGINAINPNIKTQLDNQITSTGVYPNPVKDVLNISRNDNIIFKSLEIIDLNGRVVKTNNIQAEKTPIKLDVSYLKSGLYLLKLRDQSEATKVVKFFKE